jgi:hypothetical protein
MHRPPRHPSPGPHSASEAQAGGLPQRLSVQTSGAAQSVSLAQAAMGAHSPARHSSPGAHCVLSRQPSPVGSQPFAVHSLPGGQSASVRQVGGNSQTQKPW